jgi:PAS domain S-box-containing protein
VNARDLEQVVARAGDAIVVAAPDGRIVLWNAAAERIFGWPADEALGQSLDLIVPERLRERHWEGYRQVMASGVTRYGTEVLRVPAVGGGGRSLSIAFTVALLTGADGRVTAIAAILRDETQRYQEERDLRRRLRELEAQRS